METLGDKIQPILSKNSASKFYCSFCDYGTSKKCNIESHNVSAKHKKITDGFIEGQNSAKIQPKFGQHVNKEIFVCSCGKEYHHRQGLWRHKKNCMNDNSPEEETVIKPKGDHCDNDLIMMLINDNKDLRNLLIEQCKENTEYKNFMMEQQTMMIKVLENGTHNTTHTNSHNKAFNLNFFLNETCKDAMNITDFVESIKLQLSDLERVGELGYVEGISNIIVKNLKDLDVTQRPVHCTDKKRETMYIKDEDKWEKDDEQKKMHKMVRKVADKNARMVPKFKEAHPDCAKSASRFSDQYNKIIMEAMGGKGDNDFEKEEKIIRKVSKEVIVEKDL
jgi:hypothetical protein